jgi:uncharacterized protein
MAIELPLFPLNAVLFPHMPLALHIFEDRYRAMMRDCIDAGTTFGVLAIREGLEVGAPAVPYEVGTLAQLREVTELDDGRYNLVVVGASRFRVDRSTHGKPYLTGEVTYLEDAEAGGAAQLVERVSRAFRGYVARLRESSGDPPLEIELPDEPELMSYLVAAALQVSIPERQTLLELDSARARLDACAKLLRREMVLLDHMLGQAPVRVSPQPLN